MYNIYINFSVEIIVQLKHLTLRHFSQQMFLWNIDN